MWPENEISDHNRCLHPQMTRFECWHCIVEETRVLRESQRPCMGQSTTTDMSLEGSIKDLNCWFDGGKLHFTN